MRIHEHTCRLCIQSPSQNPNQRQFNPPKYSWRSIQKLQPWKSAQPKTDSTPNKLDENAEKIGKSHRIEFLQAPVNLTQPYIWKSAIESPPKWNWRSIQKLQPRNTT
jgi:hypothetical protein